MNLEEWIAMLENGDSDDIRKRVLEDRTRILDYLKELKVHRGYCELMVDYSRREKEGAAI